MELICGDVRREILTLPDESVDIIVTSPPFWGLRDYGHPDQIGCEPTPEAYIASLTEVFYQCRRLLSPDGVFFLNVGDTYFGYWGNKRCGEEPPPSSRAWYNENKRPKFKPEGWKKDKQKALIPHRLAIALQEDGWIVRNDIVWHKPNARPERPKNRLNCANEYWFFLCKNPRTRAFHKGHLSNDLWSYPTDNNQRHNATFPLQMVEDLLRQCDGEVVFDPFTGSGTTALAALACGKRFLGIELIPEFVSFTRERIESRRSA